MSELNLDNIVGFKAVDKDGNEQNVTVDEMVDMVATRMVSALSETSSLSEISTLATAAATGNDVYENELPTVTDAANVRVLQSSGDAAQMTMQSLATKLGELLPDGTLGMHRQTLTLEPNTEGKLVAYRGIAIIHNSISNGNAIININGQIGTSVQLTVMSNSSGSISFDESGEYIQIDIEKAREMKIVNKSQKTIIMYYLSIGY